MLDKQALDNHIMGVNVQYSDLVDHECRFCGNKWTAPMVYDMGGWFYQNDDNAFCPNCGMNTTQENTTINWNAHYALTINALKMKVC